MGESKISMNVAEPWDRVYLDTIQEMVQCLIIYPGAGHRAGVANQVVT